MNTELLQCDSIALKGHVTLTATDKITGKIVAQIEQDNLVVTVGKALVGDMLIDTSGYDTGITYCAIGTGATAVAAGDTTLATEAGTRQLITKKTRASNVLTLRTFFTAAQSTINIKESGLFGHSTASGAADSGVLFSRALVAYDNSGGGSDITITWTITIT